MRETTFIDRNKDRWVDVETYQKSDPDQVASDFIDLTADLSYAKTHYPHSNITSYLNYLAGREYKAIYKKKEGRPIFDFWTKDFPLIIGHNKPALYTATVFFILFCSLGAVCSIIEPEFIESVLGKDYVSITEGNIKKGKPFGIYDNESPMNMFVKIFANNFFVGLLVFMSGIFLGLGSFINTFRNGLMVGTFLTMFFKYSLGLKAIFVIMLHGTLELMGLVIECMAGLILGLSFLFPGTLTRKQALMKGLLEGGKIFIGTIPITLMAAFIESFVTRFGKTGLENINIVVAILLAVVLAASWIFIIWYFYIFSSKIAKKINYEEYLKSFVK